LKARCDVERAVEAAKKRLALAKAMRKGVAENTGEGKKRAFPEVHAPDAVDVHVVWIYSSDGVSKPLSQSRGLFYLVLIYSVLLASKLYFTVHSP
jgi:hypothetical protein